MANYETGLTFQTLYTKALELITNSCVNCTNYNGIPPEFKQAGYSTSLSSQGSGGTVHRVTGTATIVNSTRILQVSSSQIADDYYNWMIVTQNIDTFEAVTTNKLYYFINSVSAFIQTKMRVALTESRLSTNRYTIYLTSSNSFPVVTLESLDNYDVKPYVNDTAAQEKNPDVKNVKFTVNPPEVIRASDVNQVLNILSNVIHTKVKPYPVKYTYSCSIT